MYIGGVQQPGASLEIEHQLIVQDINIVLHKIFIKFQTGKYNVFSLNFICVDMIVQMQWLSYKSIQIFSLTLLVSAKCSEQVRNVPLHVS